MEQNRETKNNKNCDDLTSSSFDEETRNGKIVTSYSEVFIMKNPENIYGKDYKMFIKRIFGVADEVCFVVDPFLDNLEELCTTEWEEIYDSALYFDYQELGTGDVARHNVFCI